jgi:hypothetical protein
VQELPGDFGVGVTVGVAVLAAAHVSVVESQLPVVQSVSFWHSPPMGLGVLQEPSSPEMSQRWPEGHDGTLQQVLLTQNSDTHCIPFAHVAPVGCGVGVNVGVRVTVRVGVFVGRTEQLPS